MADTTPDPEKLRRERELPLTDTLPRPGHCGPGICRGLTCCSYECAQGRCPSAIAAGIIPAPDSEETQRPAT